MQSGQSPESAKRRGQLSANDARHGATGLAKQAPERRSTGGSRAQVSGMTEQPTDRSVVYGAVDHLFCEQKRAQTSQRTREHRTTQSSNQSFNHSNDVNMTRVNERVSD
jgi:hypothetical protein